MSLNQILQAFDDLKITNMQSDEVKMLFRIYDIQKNGSIDYNCFLDDLVTKMSEKRTALVVEAFKHIDTNKSGTLDLHELKLKFNAQRHPDVLSRVKNPDEAQFEFCNMFTTMHSANNYFKDGRTVDLDQFVEYHTFISSQIERDCEFRNFMIGVWSMDVMENLDPATHNRTYYVD